MLFQKEEYIYAVARIRCKESKLLSNKNIEQLISMKDFQSVERYLRDMGWGNSADLSDKDILFSEQEGLWSLMKELVGDLSAFDFLRVQNDFHNIKAAVKAVYTDTSAEHLFLSGGVFESDIIYNSIKNKDYSSLPEFIAATAQEAMGVILKTGDGQLCDALIDKACLTYVGAFAKTADNELIRKYCELFTASGNIKIAVRCARLKKSADFVFRCMADCDSLNIKTMSVAAAKGFDEICNYLLTTDYKNAVVHIKDSLSAFEKWCDNFIMDLMRSQKSDPFSIGPLVAYIIAKQTEIKAVRLILTAKNNSLPDSVIRERIREMYV